MKTEVNQQNNSPVSESNSKKQAPAGTILQAYKFGTAQLQAEGENVMGVQTAQLAATNTNHQPIQLTKEGMGWGAVLGGAAGLIAGPWGVPFGAMIGGYLGHRASEPAEEQDFGSHSANKQIDPDAIGEENNGIRTLDPEDGRPDDVPLVQDYRLAMHKLHDVILVLENADRSEERQPPSPDPKKLRTVMDTVQKSAKDLAKHHKAAMRDLSSNRTVEDLVQEYEEGMQDLAVELTNNTSEGEGVINKRGYLNEGETLKESGTELWRDQWQKTKTAVNTAIGNLWEFVSDGLKDDAKENIGNDGSADEWADRVDDEDWRISYGGSLMKGYKGPPKQNTRFLSSNFDVDANMDAPAIAEYLINKQAKKVDRGQLDPKGANTGIEEMDEAMDDEVKNELVNAGIVADLHEADEIVSEQFETRVNAPDSLGDAAMVEVNRSEKEQEVRDKLTGIRKDDPDKMQAILDELLKEDGLIQNNALIPIVLTEDQITRVEEIIDAELEG